MIDFIDLFFLFLLYFNTKFIFNSLDKLVLVSTIKVSCSLKVQMHKRALIHIFIINNIWMIDPKYIYITMKEKHKKKDSIIEKRVKMTYIK